MGMVQKSHLVLIACIILSGCMSPKVFNERVGQLKIGMGEQQALEIMKGPPSAKRIMGVPEVKIYTFNVCVEGANCRKEGLVFVNDKYFGRKLTVIKLLEENLITHGLTKKDLASYGVIPNRIERSSIENINREIWLYKYKGNDQAKMQLSVFFKDGKLERWSNQEEITRTKRYLAKQEWKEFYKKVETDVEKGLLTRIEGDVLSYSKFKSLFPEDLVIKYHEKILTINKRKINGEISLREYDDEIMIELERLFPENSFIKELHAYREVLWDKLESKEISDHEFKFQWLHHLNEITGKSRIVLPVDFLRKFFEVSKWFVSVQIKELGEEYQKRKEEFDLERAREMLKFRT